MKLTLNNITSGYASNTAHNTNNDLIEAAIENTLSRDGTSPNTMSADIDMNGHSIINVDNISVTGDGSFTGNNIHTATDKTTPTGADELPIADSAATWTLKKLSFTNLVAYLSGLCSAGWNALTATTANRVDSGEVTITAHSVVGDIFGAAANSILWDDSGGAITTVIFPDAPKAGMIRELRCNGASKFTASADLLIQGLSSGQTLTVNDGATLTIRAITTTQFKITNYHMSGTFTATGVGFTTSPTATGYYVVSDGVITLNIQQITGTSNYTNFSITGLPIQITNNGVTSCRGGHFGGIIAVDNGAVVLVNGNLGDGPQINLGVGSVEAAGWTASGQKYCRPIIISCPL